MAVASLSAGSLHRPKGQCLLTVAGVCMPVGSVDLSRNITVTDQDVYTNEFFTKTLIDSQIDEMTCELTLGFRQVSLYALMMANLSNYHAVAQAAAPGSQVEFDLSSGKFPIVVPLDKRRTSGHVIEDDNGVEFVEGVHYIVHPGINSTGFVSFVGKPDGAANTGTITFDAAAAKAVRFNVGESSNIEAKVEFIEDVNPNGTVSPMYHCYHKVLFRPDGDLTLSSDSADPMILTVKGKVVADTTKPVGQRLGFIETFVEAA